MSLSRFARAAEGKRSRLRRQDGWRGSGDAGHEARLERASLCESNLTVHFFSSQRRKGAETQKKKRFDYFEPLRAGVSAAKRVMKLAADCADGLRCF
jgi:hypothetical protein